jgi:hypothetical protein
MDDLDRISEVNESENKVEQYKGKKEEVEIMIAWIRTENGWERITGKENRIIR